MLTSVAVALTLLTVMPLVAHDGAGFPSDGGSSKVVLYVYFEVTQFGPYVQDEYDHFTVTAEMKSTDSDEDLYVEPYLFTNTSNACMNPDPDGKENQHINATSGVVSWNFDICYGIEPFNRNKSKYDINIRFYEANQKKYIDEIDDYKSLGPVSGTMYCETQTIEMMGKPSVNNRYFQFATDTYSKYINESYDFSNFDPIIAPNSGNKLTFLTNTFTYTPITKNSKCVFEDAFNYTDAYILVEDKANIYPYMTKTDGNDGFRISVKPTYSSSGGQVTFSIADDYYVNPYSLDMYDSKTKNLSLKNEKTNSFYIPFGKQKAAQYNKYTLYIEGAGYNQATLYRELEYSPEIEYFGSNCNTSSYCIIGSKG